MREYLALLVGLIFLTPWLLRRAKQIGRVLDHLEKRAQSARLYKPLVQNRLKKVLKMTENEPHPRCPDGDLDEHRDPCVWCLIYTTIENQVAESLLLEDRMTKMENEWGNGLLDLVQEVGTNVGNFVLAGGLDVDPGLLVREDGECIHTAKQRNPDGTCDFCNNPKHDEESEPKNAKKKRTRAKKAKK